MAEQQLKQLREKLQSQQKEFQNYRSECKNLENFLEEQSQKKQQQIRKLKEESINKQKMYKLLKAENNQLVSEISSLKGQINKLNKNADNGSESRLRQFEEDMKNKNNQYRKLSQEFSIKKRQFQQELDLKLKQIEQKKQQIIDLKHQLNDKSEIILNHEQKIIELNDTLKRHKNQNMQIKQKYKELDQTAAVYKQKLQAYERQAKKTQRNNTLETALERQRQKWEEKTKKYQQKIVRLETTLKDYKLKLSESRLTVCPQKSKKGDEETSNFMKIYFGCVILTKPYYMSPFVEFNEEMNIVKLLKSSRHGCFEKALGATRHKVDTIAHDSTPIITAIVSKIQSAEDDYPHSILIYGGKRTAKKSIMAGIITKLYDYLKDKIQKAAYDELQAILIRKSQQQSSAQKQEAAGREQVVALIKKVMSMSTGDNKKSEKNLLNKKIEKPRILYFNLTIKDFILEVATSSLTQIPMRQKQIITTFYNNVLYSKLPDVLQSSYSQKYIVLTLNPIVDMYQDCKGTLNATLYKPLLTSPTKERLELDNNLKEELSEIAKRKLEQYEKQIEQGSLKIKKVEQDCYYYKNKFDQLQNRLKNLLSTHHAQSSYLKKSPILLSYQKLLKFVHGVLARNGQKLEFGNTTRINAFDFQDSDLDFQSEVL